MTLTYVLDGSGWATATLGSDSAAVSMTVSYLHDSLRHLAQAVIDLQDGKPEVVVVFMDEPGEHQVRLLRTGDDVAVEVKWYDDWASWKLTPASEPRTVFTTTVRLVDLRALVTEALGNILSSLGVTGYKAKWVEHEFPMAEYERLRAS